MGFFLPKEKEIYEFHPNQRSP